MSYVAQRGSGWGRIWIALTSVFVTVIVACGSSTSETSIDRAALQKGCIIDSDCVAPLRCAFKTCHVECQESRDCESKVGKGARCVVADRPFNVCQFPEESHCQFNSECPSSQHCSSDGQCRDQCKGDADCVRGQTCVQGSCADPTELVNGALPPPADGKAPILNVGQTCSYNSDCVAPLACRQGACAFECKDSRDCDRFSLCKDNVCVAKPSTAGDCVPTTCAAQGKECGVILDGCGGTKQCSTSTSGGNVDCQQGQVCGGGGPNKCGTTLCVPQTCAQLGKDCGLVTDGCSGVINCGLCSAGFTCGGAGGVSNKCSCTPDNVAACAGKQCGAAVNNCGQAVDCGNCAAGTTCGLLAANQCGCKKKTCGELGITCGSAPDACGGTLDCGSCMVAGQSCGGGGTPNQCGTGSCTPKTCLQLGKNCGTVSNGCNATLDCGATCPAGTSCGGAGVANVCGCQAKTCDQLGKYCGTVDNGCGTPLSCGSCIGPKTCGGGGTAGVCGCTPTTCAAAGKDCGSIADGCGGTISCGTCAAGKQCGVTVANVCSTPGPTPSCNTTSGSTCGPTSNDNCCRSEQVTGTVPTEVFYRRWKTASPVTARYPTHISSFNLDVYPVTVGRFRAFLNAGNTYAYKTQRPPVGAGANSNVATTLVGNEAPTWQAAWNNYLYDSFAQATSALQACDGGMWTSVPAGAENYAIRCVPWHVAFAFCAWDGGRLPTSGEYDYAAHGGTEYRDYPWGNVNSDQCNRDTFSYPYGCAAGLQYPNVRVGAVSNGDGKWGQRNLLGSVFEWNFDTSAQPQTPDCAAADCAYSNTGNGNLYRAVGGQGPYNTIGAYQYSTANDPVMGSSFYTLYADSNVGFRCARNL